MDAHDYKVFEILGGEKQYIVPVFQRYYSWKLKHWNDLWKDIVDLYKDKERTKAHFIGAFVCMAGKLTDDDIPERIIVDGQQRIITLTILLSILRNIARENSQSSLARDIEKKYLIDTERRGIKKYKVLSRSRDRGTLQKLVDGITPLTKDGVNRAAEFFRKKMEELLSTENDPTYTTKRLRKIITRQLSLVMITLDNDENAFEIFETLNERGQPLQESDLVRNYVFMKLSIKRQDDFDEDKWTPFEGMFIQTKQYLSVNLTSFYRNYLMCNGQYVPKHGIYQRFKSDFKSKTPDQIVEILDHYARLYLHIYRPLTAKDPSVTEVLLRIRDLDIGTASPLILYLLDKHSKNEMSKSDLLLCLRALESFVIRRSICGESSRGYNYLFPRVIRNIRKGSIVQSFIRFLSKSNWPDDDRFKKAFREFPLYQKEKKKCKLIISELEKALDKKEVVDLTAKPIQIEHIMPISLTDEWKTMLGEDWKRIHKTYLHTLGNLTLTGRNQEMSNRPFGEKKLELARSNLRLNREIASVEVWDEVAIKTRCENLSPRIAKIWRHHSES